jgi:predicted nucleic acid-binding protein
VRKYLLDTNIISYYLKGFESLKEKITENIDLLSISTISYYEIVSGLQSINAKRRITVKANRRGLVFNFAFLKLC